MYCLYNNKIKYKDIKNYTDNNREMNKKDMFHNANLINNDTGQITSNSS